VSPPLTALRGLAASTEGYKSPSAPSSLDGEVVGCQCPAPALAGGVRTPPRPPPPPPPPPLPRTSPAGVREFAGAGWGGGASDDTGSNTGIAHGIEPGTSGTDTGAWASDADIRASGTNNGTSATDTGMSVYILGTRVHGTDTGPATGIGVQRIGEMLPSPPSPTDSPSAPPRSPVGMATASTEGVGVSWMYIQGILFRTSLSLSGRV
jgi:hypothetical protein